MIDRDHVAAVPRILRKNHAAGGRRRDRRALGGRDVDPGMHDEAAEHRVIAHPERRGDRAGNRPHHGARRSADRRHGLAGELAGPPLGLAPGFLLGLLLLNQRFERSLFLGRHLFVLDDLGLRHALLVLGGGQQIGAFVR